MARNLRRRSANYRARYLHNGAKPRKTTRSKKTVRAPEDPPAICIEVKEISETTAHRVFTGEDPPWILKRATNWVSGLRNSDKVGINPKDALGAAKVPMHLVPPASTIMQALCMDDGNIKYGPYNVRMEDIQAIGYISAAKRHLDAYLDGQDFDSISGKPHLGYALATIGLVIDAWLNGTLIDNRPVSGLGGQLLDELAMKPGEEPRSPGQLKDIFERIAEYGKQQTETRRSK